MERNYPKVSINIVAWNSMRFLPELLASIEKQTFRDFNILIIDNGSSDGVESFVRTQFPQITFLRNAKNLGFCFAHNQGIRYVLDRLDPTQTSDRYVLVTNPDIIMSETFLEELVRAADLNPHVASVGGKLRKAFGEHVHDELLQETVRSDRLDSTGLRPQKNGMCADRGAGEMDEGQYDQQELVFGISGALVLYRARALQDARYEDEFFDDDFFAYKEDVDLAWRLQLLGWDALYVPSAVSYHYRGMYGKERMSLLERFKNRRMKSKTRSYFSNRNHWLMLLKNMHVSTALLWSPILFVTECFRVLYTLLFETRNMKSFFEAIVLLPKMIKKRLHVMKRKKRSAGELRHWFV